MWRSPRLDQIELAPKISPPMLLSHSTFPDPICQCSVRSSPNLVAQFHKASSPLLASLLHLLDVCHLFHLNYSLVCLLYPRYLDASAAVILLLQACHLLCFDYAPICLCTIHTRRSSQTPPRLPQAVYCRSIQWV